MNLVRILTTATAGAMLAFAASSANAADVYAGGGSLKDGPVYAPTLSWTGFYLGVGGGVGATSQDLKASLDYYREGIWGEADGLGGVGPFGTVQVGYDRQIDQRFVVGAFFDYDFASIDSSIKVGAHYGDEGGSIKIPFNLSDSWSVGGRVGYLVNPNTLFYGLAAYTEASFDLPRGFSNDTFTGYTVGAGLETSLGGNWFLKGEYRYTSLEKQTVFQLGGGEEGTFKITDEPTIQTGRLVLTYKLNAFDHASLK